MDGVKLLTCHFRDLKIKDFISTISTSIPGKARSTKHHGLVNQPQVAEQYLQAAAAINIHNYNQSGSAALEDVWHTKNPRQRQLAGILGFCFTNGFLAMKYFTDKHLKQHTFKMAVAQALTSYQTINLYKTRQLEKSSITENAIHTMAKLQNPEIVITAGMVTPHHGPIVKVQHSSAFNAMFYCANHPRVSVGSFI